MSNYTPSPVLVSQAEESERAVFIKKTYLHVALAVCSFVLIETIFFKVGFAEKFAEMIFTSGQWTWLFVLGLFMFASNIANKWSHDSTSQQYQYMGLITYTIIEAIVFIPLLYIATIYTEGPVIMQAAVLTLALFAGLSLIVLTTKKDFSFLRSALMIGGWVAIGLIVAGMLFGFNLGLWFSVAMVALAGGSILYQTSNMVHHYNTSQYVGAALGLFASLMLMFYYILMILMRLGRD